ncbi:MAG: putative phosphoglucomutase [Bryobacterales bacterium]|nr:putative phosphoglucomutase [Bryobacterales bacterium]
MRTTSWYGRYTRVVLADLLSTLLYRPEPLLFGTSGRRGRVVDLTQLEMYINVTAELEFLLALPVDEGGIRPGEQVFFAHDLRPSSTRFSEEAGGRGELCQAVVRAVADAGLMPVNLGPLPTPALAAYAWPRHRASIMVTGSHIPFDLNGYKLNTSVGELLKEYEAPINEAVARVRARLYQSDAAGSLFDAYGMLKAGSQPMARAVEEAREEYLARYTDVFGGRDLGGRRVLVYQHSAVGRDLLAELLRRLGADVVTGGRSDTFVAIDTEAIDAAQLAAIQMLADTAVREHGPLWAVASTDGDSDRPLILGLDGAAVKFFGGDLVGMVVAGYLGADSVVVPISCNDSIDRGPLAGFLEPKTKIGSPHVVAGMARARARGRKVVCGWEANGGFLLGSDVVRGAATLRALPTRDAFLPLAAVLFAAHERDLSLPDLFAELPPRFSRAGLVRNLARDKGRRIVEILSEPSAVKQLSAFFTAADGFSAIRAMDYTDGVRIIFDNGDVAHFRPSGNADEFRMYAVADTAERAAFIVERGTAEPGGIVRLMERALATC